MLTTSYAVCIKLTMMWYPDRNSLPQIRPLAFVLGALLLLLNSLRDIFPELMSMTPEQREGGGCRNDSVLCHVIITVAMLSTKNMLLLVCLDTYELCPESAMKIVRSFTTKFWMLLARVPNDSILEHR